MDIPKNYPLNGQLNKRKIAIPSVGSSTPTERLKAAQHDGNLNHQGLRRPIDASRTGGFPKDKGRYF